MTELPAGWVAQPFSLLNNFRSASIDPTSCPDETFELYSVPAYSARKPELVRGAEIGSTKQLVSSADVLICKINPRINRVWQVAPKGTARQIASSEWIGFRAPGLYAGFFRHYYSSPAFRDQLCTDLTGVGGSLTRAQPKRVDEFMVPVAPLTEQQRIADKLDTVLARAEACRDRLGRVSPLLKRFRQSVLTAAMSGRLTEDWRNDRGASAYTRAKLDALCQAGRVITYGVVKLGEESPGGVPCLRTSNVRWLRFDLDGTKRISPEISATYARTVLVGNEVLVNVRGTLGGVAVATSEMIGWNISREVAVVPVDETKINPQFAALWIASEETQRWLSKVERGVAYVGINIEDLRELPVLLPSNAEQAEIIRRVKALFAFADRLEGRLALAQTAVDRMTPALLAKAFRGELVPQDPADEPAAELLRRLATQREAAPTRRRQRTSS